MQAGSVRKTIYKWAWDTRCRNADVSRILRPLLNSGSTILDAGCGEFGLSEFLTEGNIVGLDVVASSDNSDRFTFVRGSIIALPFAERSFSIVTSVDVLEHLPASIRPEAIRQLVRVAEKTVVIAFPFGDAARRVDEAFNKKLSRLKQPVPDWLAEHLQNPYPEIAAVINEIELEANRLGRKIRMTLSYSENLSAAKFLRWSAARSRYVYLFANLFLGLLLPTLPRVKREEGYRSIILAEFEDD